MSHSEVQRRFEDLLSGIQRPARLIGGEPGSGPGFTGDSESLRVVLGFPDTYEIGISNQAIQILYGLARKTPGVEVERVYLPWVDAMAQMRKRDVCLLTMETWSPVREADLLGVTLQHEFGYTSVLEMLDLAGVPLRAEARGQEHPLVIAGGPSCADFLPMSPFLDAVVVGDGEETFPELLEVLTRAKREGLNRAECKRRASQVEGVYVPGVSTGVARRWVARLEGAFYPDDSLVPLTEGVHDRAWVEVMRGCTRGCRFCQAGMWYRPVRERTPGAVLDIAEGQLRSAGHQEVAFASLSTTDYSCIEQLLEGAARRFPETRVSLPSLRVDSAAVRLARLASPTGPSLTLAPEAGSQRMRDVVNKNVTEADILGAAQEAFRAGKTTLKLYFMIGLPWEDDADVRAIVSLCLKLRESGREMLGQRANRLRLNVSVNNFVPKPFTPFQWVGMADREVLLRRQRILRDGLRKRAIRLALSNVDKSYVEAALARGGTETADVIEEAWRRGARFDSWTEEFRADAWEAAFASMGSSAEELAVASYGLDETLPWEFIEGNVGGDFLRSEWHKARDAITTGDCRWEGCSECGACADFPANDLAVDAGPGAEIRTQSGEEVSRRHIAGAGTADLGLAERRRYLLRFSVEGRGRYLGHLDRAEILRRTVRRAGGRMAMSAGMRPKPLLSLALPLAVGMEGKDELAEFTLAEEPPADFAELLAGRLPTGMRLLALEPGEVGRSLASRVEAASYEVEIDIGEPTISLDDVMRRLSEGCARFLGSETLEVQDSRQGKQRLVDVKQYVAEVLPRAEREGPLVLSFTATVSPGGTARPEHVVGALKKLTGLDPAIVRVRRTHIHLREVDG